MTTPTNKKLVISHRKNEAKLAVATLTCHLDKLIDYAIEDKGETHLLSKLVEIANEVKSVSTKLNKL